MKRLISIVLCLVACLAFSSCKKQEPADSTSVTLKYADSASSIIPLLKTDKIEYGILGEPAVSQANKVAGTQIILDLQEEYKKINGQDAVYPQVGMYISEDLGGDKPFVYGLMQTMDGIKNELINNAPLLKDKLLNIGSTLNVDFTEEIINRLNIGNKYSGEIKEDIENYYTVIKEYDKTFIGGELPSDDFYYYAVENTVYSGQDRGEVVLTVPDGAPSVVAVLLNGKKIAGYTIKVEVKTTAQLVLNAYTSGNAKIVLLPSNIIAKTFNKNTKGKLLSINIFGVLYMVGKTPINKLQDLKGKTVYNIGIGGTPDLTLRYLLKENGIKFKE